MQNPPTPRHRALIVLLFTVLALVYTFPLALHFSTHITGPAPGDNYEYVWKMWWVGHAVTTPDLNPFFNPRVYYPHGYPLAYGELTPAHTFGFLPLTLLTNATVAHNVAGLLSIILTGWATYEWAHYRLRKDAADSGASGWVLVLAALIAALAFTFYPNRAARMAGHIPMMSTQWMVLALLGVDWWLNSRHWRDAAVIGAGIALAALSSWYYPFMLLLLLPVYVIAQLGRATLATLRSPRTWGALAVVAGIVALLTVPFLIPYLRLDTSAAAVALDSVRFWSLSPVDYFVPNPRHPLYGDAAQRLVWYAPGEMPHEFYATPGYVVLVLGFIAWGKTQNRALKWLAAVALLLSLGPFLTIGRIPTPVPLPALLIHSVFDSVRTYARFSLPAVAAWSVLAGYGYLHLMGHIKRRRVQVALTAGIVLLGAFQLLNGKLGVVPVAPRDVDVWLAAQPDDAPIMQYPVAAALSGPAMLYTRYHGKPVIYGYGTYFPYVFERDHGALYTFPDNNAVEVLAAWGVHYVLVDWSATGDTFTREDVAAQPRLQFVTEFGDDAVYAIAAP